MGKNSLTLTMGTIPPPNASNADMIYIPIGIYFGICPLIVGVRLWSRRKKSGKLDIDDFVILAALVGSP